MLESRSGGPRRRRSALAAALLGAVLIGGVAIPAAGDTLVSSSGQTGASHLVDGEFAQGAICRYDPVDGGLAHVDARPPVAFATNRTGGPDQQDVSVRARLEASKPAPGGGSAWVTVARSPIDRKVATETTSPFKTWASFPVYGPWPWRVLWEIRWFDPAHPTQVSGLAVRAVDVYGQRVGSWIRAGRSAGSCPGSRAGAPSLRITHGPDTVKEVALTFDMGVAEPHGLQLMRWLRDHNVHATIFTTGVAATGSSVGRTIIGVVKAHRDLFDIGNHSWDHPMFTTISAEEIAYQLQHTDDLVTPLAGGTTKPLFRPPYGNAHQAQKDAAGAAGWALDIIWDVPTTDYLPISRGGPTTHELIDQVLSKVKAGSIVVLHVDGPRTLSALPGILSGLASRGLAPVRLRDLLHLDDAMPFG